MDKKSPFFQLMDLRMNGIMNELTAQDEDYQSLIKKADEYTDRLEALNLSRETLNLIDRYATDATQSGAAMGCLRIC